ncbi:hypothetical protein GH714_035546 [Hevea brasiliensis]|uniref:Pentatricopeptide repeat-containing protein n=1 Tax=Hevea brasiliensis TaxID=3981 RepID=A0A6A6KDR7_HEVBR|nr:hypothetical protein GH714_035546 [Hevea brasiliensis]
MLLHQGVQVHGAVAKQGLGFDLLNNDLIDVYGKCVRMDAACAVFDRMLERNVVSWTALIYGHIQNGNAEESLFLFSQMGLSGVKSNEFTFSMNLKACGMLNLSDIGIQIHDICVKTRFDMMIVYCGSLIDHYVKCGKFCEARRVFGEVEQKHVISWSAIILGYAQEGNLAEAMDLFRQLRESDIQADGFVLSSMIGVFADFALVEQGKQMHACTIKVPSWFQTYQYAIQSWICIICGAMDEAERFFAKCQREM